MATEHVLEVPVRRHIIDSGQPFASVLDGIFGGISQPDIGPLFSDLEASTSYEQFSSLVQQTQGSGVRIVGPDWGGVRAGWPGLRSHRSR